MVRSAPDPGNGVVDSLQRPVREARGRPAPVSLLVVAEEVDMDDRQAPRHIDLYADRGELAHQDDDRHPHWNEFQLLEEGLAVDNAAHAVDDGEPQLDHQEHRQAQKAEPVAEDQYSHHQRVGFPQCRTPALGGGAEMRLRRAAGEVVGIGAAARQQWFAPCSLELALDTRGNSRLEHAHETTACALHEIEARHDAPDAVEELALDRGCRGRHTCVMPMQPVVFAGNQPSQEGHLAPLHGRYKLPVRKPVDLYHD